MKKKFYNSEKFQAVFFPVLYFFLAVALVVTGCFIFKKKYYQPVVVDGTSMLPTLAGGSVIGTKEVDEHSSVPLKYRYNYGIADLHENSANIESINNIKRFDVIVTYYPQSWGTVSGDYIIKRVWGLPGETISLLYDSESKTYTFTAQKGKKTDTYTAPVVEYTKTFDTEYVVDGKYHFSKTTITFTAAKFKLPHKTFYTNIYTGRQFVDHKLGKNEYFVMGDNWETSTDSYKNMSNPHKLTKSYLRGRVLYIYAYISLVNDQPKYIREFSKRYNF